MSLTKKHRDIEYRVQKTGMAAPKEWAWTYFPKMGTGVREDGLAASYDEAETACKKAIDKFLGLTPSN